MRAQTLVLTLLVLIVFSSVVLAEQPESSANVVVTSSRPVDPDSIPYFLNEYPEFSGYTITRKQQFDSLEAVFYQKGEFESSDYSTAVFNNLVVLNPSVYDAVFEQLLNTRKSYEIIEINGNGPYFGENFSYNDESKHDPDNASPQSFLAWVAGNRIISITFSGEYPKSIIDYFIVTFPLEAAPEPETYSIQEKMSLLYTSKEFENPSEWGQYIAARQESSALCYSLLLGRKSQTAAEHLQVINETLGVRASSFSDAEKRDMADQCARLGNFTIPGIPIPYDIESCKIRFSNELAQASVSATEEVIIQECMIEAYSRQKWVESGKNVDEFEEILQKRIPEVIKLVKMIQPRTQDCIDTPEGVEICKPRNVQGGFEVLDPNFVIEKFHLVETWEGVPITEPGAMETQVIVDGGYKNIVILGNEVWSRTPLQIRDGKAYLGNFEVPGFLPELETNPIEGKAINEAEVVQVDGQEIIEIKTVETGKILSLFPVELSTTFKVNRQTKELVTEKPWWSFFFA